MLSEPMKARGEEQVHLGNTVVFCSLLEASTVISRDVKTKECTIVMCVVSIS